MNEPLQVAWPAGHHVNPRACFLSCRLEAEGFPVHLLPDIAEPGSMAGRTSHTWFEILKGTQVGVALGDLQASVYSCMGQRTDAGKFAFCSILRFMLVSPQYPP